MRVSAVLFSAAIGLAVAVSFLTCTPATRAETIEIVFTGLDFTYGTPRIYDATSVAGRNTNPGESDSVTSVLFSRESGDETDASSTYVDILLEGVSGIPALGGSDKSSNADSFGIDVFSTDGIPWSLQLDLSQLNVAYIGPGVAVFALGKASSVYAQSLPFGMPPIDTSQPVQVSIVSGTLSNVQTSGGVLTGFTAANGVGTISAVLIPEPSTLLGLLTGVLTLAAYAWARRKR